MGQKGSHLNIPSLEGLTLTLQSLEAVFLGIVPKGPIADPQAFGRARSHTTCSFECGLQVSAFRRGNFLFKINPLGREFTKLPTRSSCPRSFRIAEDPIGKNARRDFPSSLQRDGALHRVFEFANVSRPIVRFQTGHRFGRNALDRLFHRPAKPLKEMARQKWYILAALTQRWHVDGNHTEPIKKVFAEAAFCNFLFELLVRSGYDADIHIRFVCTAHRPDLAFLQNAVELHLHGEAHVTDFVHEKRSAMSGLE